MAAGVKNTLLFVLDCAYGRQFLIDTGAQISVLPATRADVASGKRGCELVAANGTSIQTFGKRTVPV